MTMIQSEQSICPVSVGKNDQRGIRDADVLILVPVDHRAGFSKVSGLHGRQFPGAA